MSKLHWTILGILSTALLLYMVWPYIDVIMYGIFVYYILRPLYKRINKSVASKDVCAALAILALVLPLILLLYYTVSVASTEIFQLLQAVDDPLGERLKASLSNISRSVKTLDFDYLTRLIQENQDYGKFIIELSKSSLGIIFRFILVFAVAFYLLKYGSGLKRWLLSTVKVQKERDLTRKFIHEIDEDLYHVFFGNILVALVTSILGAVTFVVIDLVSPSAFIEVPYPILLGALCGIANLIPIVGMKIVWIPLVGYLFLNAFLHGILATQIVFLVLTAIGIYIIVDWFPDMVLRPYLSGTDRIPMGLLFFTYIFGATVFGISGILIGPAVVIVALTFMRIVLPEIKKK